MNNAILTGKRVMVCEDELLVAMLVEDVLTDHDCVLLGPFTTVAQAMVAAQDEKVDIAVLDVNLSGQKIYPVADVLAARGIPFFLLSGYGQDAVPANRPDWRACSKPFDTMDLVAMLAERLEADAAAKG